MFEVEYRSTLGRMEDDGIYNSETIGLPFMKTSSLSEIFLFVCNGLSCQVETLM